MSSEIRFPSAPLVSPSYVSPPPPEVKEVSTPEQEQREPQHGEEEEGKVVEVIAHGSDKYELAQVWTRTLRTMLRSAVYAAAARIALGLLKSILKSGGRPKKFMTTAATELLSLNPAKWALLISSLSSYRGLQQTIERAVPFPLELGPTLSSAIAGAVSSLGFFAMNLETRTELTMYTGVRAAHGLLSAHAYTMLPGFLQRFQHWDVAAMCLSACQIMYCLMFESGCNPEKYQTFLENCTTADRRVLRTVAALSRSTICPEMVDYARERNLPILSKDNMKQCCTYLHPGMSCGASVAQFIYRHMTRFSLPLYVPLKLTTTWTFGYAKAMKNPLKATTKALLGALQSAVFLTAYCVPPWAGMCVFANAGIHSPAGLGAFAGVFAGLFTFIEPKGRRLDLAIYCMMQAFRSFVLLLARRGWISRPTRHHITAMTMASFAAMFYQFDHEPKQLHPNVCKSLAWITAEKRLKVTEVLDRKPLSPSVLPPVEVLGDDDVSDGDYSRGSTPAQKSSAYSLTSLAAMESANTKLLGHSTGSASGTAIHSDGHLHTPTFSEVSAEHLDNSRRERSDSSDAN